MTPTFTNESKRLSEDTYWVDEIGDYIVNEVGDFLLFASGFTLSNLSKNSKTLSNSSKNTPTFTNLSK